MGFDTIEINLVSGIFSLHAAYTALRHFWCNEMPHESVQTNKQKKYKNSQAQAKPE